MVPTEDQFTKPFLTDVLAADLLLKSKSDRTSLKSRRQYNCVSVRGKVLTVFTVRKLQCQPCGVSTREAWIIERGTL